MTTKTIIITLYSWTYNIQDIIFMTIIIQRKGEGKEVYWVKVLYTVEIKLVLIWTGLLQTQILIITYISAIEEINLKIISHTHTYTKI